MPDIFIEDNKQYKSQPMLPLAGFALHPDGVHFSSQQDDEKIHLFLRRHFITNIPWIILIVFLIILPLALTPFTGLILPSSFLAEGNRGLIFLWFYYIVIFGLALTNFINWYFNVYIVTNQRVVDVDFINIIYREVSSTRLNLIQDVTVKTGGVIKSIFDFGNVLIQTAGTEINFDFLDVPHPQQVAREIENLMDASRKKDGKSTLEEDLET